MNCLALDKPIFPLTTKVIALLWTVFAVLKRIMIIIVYFIPVFGLFNLLHHWQFEQIQFAVRSKERTWSWKKEVISSEIKGSNTRRQERGDFPIPTSVNIFKLKAPTREKPYVNVKNIKSVQCVTYVCDPDMRAKRDHSGYYINVFPWVHWSKGVALPQKQIKDGDKCGRRKNSEMILRKEHKKVKPPKESDYSILRKQRENRLQLLKSMGIDVNSVLKPSFLAWNDRYFSPEEAKINLLSRLVPKIECLTFHIKRVI